MTNNQIDDILWRIRRTAITSDDPKRAESAVDDIEWYVRTGRASSGLIKALGQCRPSVLIRKITPVWSCSDDVIRVTKQHLHFR